MNRRQFLRTSAIGTAALALSRQRSPAATSAIPHSPNILFITADDLNHWIGSLGRNPQTKTPVLDRFASQSVNFVHNYCPAPVCNPARCAFMSGRHPSTTGVYGNGNRWNSAVDEKQCLNGFLKANGYHTMGAGKVYHISPNPDQHTQGVEWDKYIVSFGREAREDAAAKQSRMTMPLTVQNPGPDTDGYIKLGGMDIGRPDIPDTDTEDNKIARWAASQLRREYDKPFFMALGFHKPHTPLIVPKKYFDLFPLETIALPPHILDDADDLPPSGKAWANTGPWKQVYGTGDAAGIKRWKQVIQAYLACIAYLDTQIGIVLDALDKSRHKDNTIVVFLPDHGWHFGEKQRFYKFTLWEESARVPFIWRVPGLTPPGGAKCERPVESLSLFPTLCDLAGLPKPAYLDGASIKPLLENPRAEWTRPALTTHGYMNHAVRTERWRYIRYANGDEELYDEKADAFEWRNLANEPKYDSVKKELAKSLPAKNARPKNARA